MNQSNFDNKKIIIKLKLIFIYLFDVESLMIMLIYNLDKFLIAKYRLS